MTPQSDSNTAVLSPDRERGAMLIARIERLPISSFHVRVRVIMGTATFFDAFGVFTIGYVLPVLAGLWVLRPDQVGYLLAAGFVGMAFGAVFFGWLAQRIGIARPDG